MILKGRLVEMEYGDVNDIPQASIEIDEQELYNACVNQLNECRLERNRYSARLKEAIKDERLLSTLVMFLDAINSPLEK